MPWPFPQILHQMYRQCLSSKFPDRIVPDSSGSLVATILGILVTERHVKPSGGDFEVGHKDRILKTSPASGSPYEFVRCVRKAFVIHAQIVTLLQKRAIEEVKPRGFTVLYSWFPNQRANGEPL